MADLIVIIILALVVGAAVLYIVRAKKRGAKCIGCPDGGTCSGNCGGCLGRCSSVSDSRKNDK